MKKGKKRKQILDRYAVISVLSILSFLLLWQILVATGILSDKILPAPTKVFAAFFDKLGNKSPDGSLLQTNIFVSLKVACSGLFLAIIIGVPLGWLMGWYKPVSRFIRPIFELMRPIPPIAWIPLTILWVGIGLEAKAMIIFFASFVPCVINATAGIKSTNQTLINVAKTYGASDFTIFLKIGIPSSLPMTFAGIRIALNSAWSTLVAAELLAANAGLGYMINMGRQFGRVDIIVLGMFTIGVLGFLFSWGFKELERFLVKWRTV